MCDRPCGRWSVLMVRPRLDWNVIWNEGPELVDCIHDRNERTSAPWPEDHEILILCSDRVPSTSMSTAGFHVHCTNSMGTTLQSDFHDFHVARPPLAGSRGIPQASREFHLPCLATRGEFTASGGGGGGFLGTLWCAGCWFVGVAGAAWFGSAIRCFWVL